MNDLQCKTTHQAGVLWFVNCQSGGWVTEKDVHELDVSPLAMGDRGNRQRLARLIATGAGFRGNAHTENRY
jgi:hypothetical protein